jgi:SOS-response transcriptional repressor LexA
MRAPLPDLSRTDRDHQVLCYIAEHENVHGETPSLNEIRRVFGCKSQTTIKRSIDRLVRTGKLRRRKSTLEILT